MYPGFTDHQIAPGFSVHAGTLEPALVPDSDGFDALWDLHPERYHEVVFAGVRRDTPRWQQAFGFDYRFAGSVNRAAPIPSLLAPLLEWAQRAIDSRINGMLVNWYDGELQHRIGRHKDSPLGLIPECPIVTVSFGARRTFVMHVKKTAVPFPTDNGSVIVIPAETNRRFAHSVPHFADDVGRRISVTLRGFLEQRSSTPT